ncbi:MAG: type VI secretion system lipoprotein TssJ [Gammaproteobacteria bacterium]
MHTETHAITTDGRPSSVRGLRSPAAYCLHAVLVMALASSLSACTTTIAGVTKGILDKITEEDPTTVSITFKSSSGLNPSAANRPSPVVVRLYELSSLGALERADFFSLYDDAETVLGADLHGSEELRILPGQTRSVERELDPESKYVAIVAAYRNIENARWRDSYEVELFDENPLLVTLDNLAVSIALADD